MESGVVERSDSIYHARFQSQGSILSFCFGAGTEAKHHIFQSGGKKKEKKFCFVLPSHSPLHLQEELRRETSRAEPSPANRAPGLERREKKGGRGTRARKDKKKGGENRERGEKAENLSLPTCLSFSF